MRVIVTYARFLLYPGEVLRVDGRERLAIRCEQGGLWLTAGCEGIDHNLSHGEQAICDSGRILIEGQGVLTLAAAAHDCRLPSMIYYLLLILRRWLHQPASTQLIRGESHV